MAYVARPADFRVRVPLRRATAPVPAAPRPGFLQRLFNAIIDHRERQAERDAEAYLARRGYRLTDSVEREINERLFNGGWNARR